MFKLDSREGRHADARGVAQIIEAGPKHRQGTPYHAPKPDPEPEIDDFDDRDRDDTVHGGGGDGNGPPIGDGGRDED